MRSCDNGETERNQLATNYSLGHLSFFRSTGVRRYQSEVMSLVKKSVDYLNFVVPSYARTSVVRKGLESAVSPLSAVVCPFEIKEILGRN